jgi:hypothetical protein
MRPYGPLCRDLLFFLLFPAQPWTAVPRTAMMAGLSASRAGQHALAGLMGACEPGIVEPHYPIRS